MEKNEKRNRRRSRRISGGDILALLVLACVIWVIPSFLLDKTNPDGLGEYGIYNGPILPLSSLSGGEGLEVSRDVTLDFAIYYELKEYSHAPERVRVTDAYTLTNPTEQTVTVKLSWPFEGRLSEQLPVITVDGEPAQATVWPAKALNDGKGGINDFGEYAAALSEKDLLAEAMAPAQTWDQTVKVYHFYNLNYEGEEREVPPMLGISYKYSNKTNLWMRSCDMSGIADGREHLYFDLDEDVWLYVVGEDLQELEIGGAIVHTFGIHTASQAEGVTWEVETFDASFSDCLWEAVQVYTCGEDCPGGALVTPEMLYNHTMGEIAEKKQMPGNSYSMEGYFYELYTDQRMLYWVFPVEIPAGESVTVTGSYVKKRHYFSDEVRHGYDLATTLGSDLHFTEQKVRLVNTEPVAIMPRYEDGQVKGFRQNFGFDLHKGITEVTLDLTQEWYYVDLMVLTEQ